VVPERTPIEAAAPPVDADMDSGPRPPPPYRPFGTNSGNPYLDRFASLWNTIHDPSSGFFSVDGVPYHAVETLDVDAPPSHLDYGHETTAETYSYYVWLEAMCGKLEGDWSYLEEAWSSLERNLVPHHADQPTAERYDAHHPAAFAPELDLPGAYPAVVDPKVTVGIDPLDQELRHTYGTADIYGMHAVLDVDNWFGFGNHADGVSKPSCVNVFGRGPEESGFETIPHPCWDELTVGGKSGYLDLFVRGADGVPPTKQWTYTAAPDAAARAIQAAFWAKVWFDQGAEQQTAAGIAGATGEGGARTAGDGPAADGGAAAVIARVVRKAARLGDYLRYALFDKHFKSQGCVTPECPAATDERGGAHYLLGSSYAWGGAVGTVLAGGGSWRIGSSTAQGGHQNPLAAYALARVPDFKPASPTGAADWGVSLDRQIELLRWLQSSEGAIGGGATNGWAGRYGPYPSGMRTFYGLGYDEQPVHHDPPSNAWFGFQAWSMDRLAELYFVTGDERAKVILDRWVPWVLASVKLPGADYAVPSTLAWSGQPQLDWSQKTQNFTPGDQAYNFGLHVRIKSWSNDAALASATARALAYYAARCGDRKAQQLARELLDRMWARYRDPRGVATPELRVDYKRFNDRVGVPPGWIGKMPNGEIIDGASTFASLRSKLQQDPDWPKVAKLLRGAPAAKMITHRFWEQADIAIANGAYGMLFPQSGSDGPNGKRGRADARDKKKGGQ